MIYDLIGWIGAVILLLAYFLITAKKIPSQSKIYHLLNLLGALAGASYLYLKGATPWMIFNLFWAGVSILGLLKQGKEKEQ